MVTFMVIYAYSLPAIFAFITKVLLLVYSRLSPLRDARTRLFGVALLLSMTMNVVEVMTLQLRWGDLIPYYYAAAVPFCAILFHLTVRVAFDEPPKLFRWLCAFTYGYAMLLEVLLASPPLLIAGSRPLGGYTFTGIHGPLFPLLEIFLEFTLLTTLLLPIRGITRDRNGRLRSRCQIWVLAAAPACLLVIVVLVLHRLDLRWFNATVTLPIPMTLLMVAIAYCVHNERVIEPVSYVPFSKVKRLKNRLYAALTSLAQSSSRAESVPQLLDRLSQALQCPVWLVGPDHSVSSSNNTDSQFDLPIVDITNVQHMAVAGELKGALHDLLKKHHIGAVVPLFPHSHTARSWLVFGDAFGQSVYTPADFQTIERVIRQLAGVFLDSLVKATHGPAYQPGASTNKTGLEMQPEPGINSPQVFSHPLAERLAEYEAFLIKEALRSCKGNQAKAARLLGLQPSTLHYKIKRLNLRT